jgi:hypothetical protein
MLFPNMISEIICQILFESSKEIFERLKKTSLDEKFSRIFSYFRD